jgi:hypothetical protein
VCFHYFLKLFQIIRPYIKVLNILWVGIYTGERHRSSFSFLFSDTSFHSNICWRGHFSIIYFGPLCQKSGGHSYVDSYLGLLFCSIGVHVCFCASAMLFWLLWLCNVVWSQGFWYLQLCCFCLDYSRSFVLPFEFSGLLCHWNFGGDCIEHVDCFGNIAISIILILSINECGRSFHLL